jgi:hypothetical protein
MSIRKIPLLFLFIIWFAMQPSLIAAAMVPVPVPPIQGIDWSEPVNLSQSGAASNPHLFSSKDGKLQALWWDRFDGMVLSQYDAGTWSAPFYQSLRSDQLTAVPYTLADDAGGLHAFWIETNQVEMMGKRETLTALKYSVRGVESAAWSEPVFLAESAASFAAYLTPSGDIMLAYVRVKHTPEVPAGMYYMHKKNTSTTWDLPRAVDVNIYYRLSAGAETLIHIAGVDQNAFITWNDREGRSVFAASGDSGASWEISSPFESSESYSNHTRLILPQEGQELIAIWEDGRASTCNLYQQSLNLQVNGEPVVQPEWTAAVPVGLSVTSCPHGDWFSFSSEYLIWVWGEGTSQLTIAARDLQTGEWSLPQNFSFNFTTDMEQSISMGSL